MAPKKIKKRINANHEVFLLNLVLPQIKIVWINSVSPMARGCFIFLKFKEVIKAKAEIQSNEISENSLYKIITLEVIEAGYLFFWSFEKFFLLSAYKTDILVKLPKLNDNTF